jgi:hypothetical protein
MAAIGVMPTMAMAVRSIERFMTFLLFPHRTCGNNAPGPAFCA